MRLGLLLAIALLGDPFAAGVRAFRAGAFAEALAAFDAAIAEAGDDAPAAWHYDRALAALHAGEWTAAEEACVEALRLGGAAWESRVAFARGCVAAARADEAARFAAQPDAIPSDWDLAIARGRAAFAAFASAAETHGEDLPAARRNAERALLRLAEWEARREAAAPSRPEATPRPEPERVEELLRRLERMERPPPPAPEQASVERDW